MFAVKLLSFTSSYCEHVHMQISNMHIVSLKEVFCLPLYVTNSNSLLEVVREVIMSIFLKGPILLFNTQRAHINDTVNRWDHISDKF